MVSETVEKGQSEWGGVDTKKPPKTQAKHDERPWQWEESGYTVTRTSSWTAPGCHEGCGVLLYTKDGILEKVEGDPEDPFNQGRLCPRCFTLPTVLYHEDRIKHPMRRVGERGEGKWEQISWSEALDICEREFKRIAEAYGPETIHFWRGTGRDIFWQVGRLAYAMGTPNEYAPSSGTSCYLPRLAAMIMTTGGQTIHDQSQFFADRYDNPDWVLPECILMWGCNPTLSNTDFFLGHWNTDCMKLGSKLITVDPRVTWLASRSEYHLQLRPGTDAALALGLLNVIINEDLYDHDFVDRWTYGFDELTERVQEYPVEKVAEITWIPAERIRGAARLYATSKPACIVWGLALDMMKNGVPASQAVAALWTITGNFDIPGGNVFTQFPMDVRQMMSGGWGYEEFLSEEMQKKRIGYDEYPMYRFGLLNAQPDLALERAEAGLLKGLWIQSSNGIACMACEVDRWTEVIKNAEFVAACDLFMTPTIQVAADIVLPVACWPEKKSLRGHYYYLAPICGSVTPVGEVKSDAEINRLLGKRFNEEAWPWDNEEEILDTILKPSGFTYQELRDRGYVYPEYTYRKYEKGLLRADGQPGFHTPTGRVELYSIHFQNFGYDPLPYYEEPALSPVSTPDLYKEYNLVLMTGARSPVFFHSEHRQIPYLRQINSDPYVEIHPDFAKENDINEGDWVWLENPRGRCRQRAKLTQAILPGTALGQHAWWYPEEEGSEPHLYGMRPVNINYLLVNAPAVHGFGADIKATLCKIYKVKEGEM
ncbi:MAG: molybdopterin-dependent oxidoreductase [Coriobacteriales bacterium]|jgi:anaerobic selenocysteine-containing dehydrogenase|nr:molybdopterin-dependent oxidoreductase [Coriobacteriales bacterium]